MTFLTEFYRKTFYESSIHLLQAQMRVIKNYIPGSLEGAVKGM